MPSTVSPWVMWNGSLLCLSLIHIYIYVHESADFDKALNIIVNAKTQRVGVCNAAESLLVDRAVADRFLPAVVAVPVSYTHLQQIEEFLST